jgi:hypothetical protein
MGMSPQPCTTKQMGDSCEMLVAAEMTLAGVPAMKMPDNWPCYDVIAQPNDGRLPQRISVKSRTFKLGGGDFAGYDAKDQFDWLAIVLLPGADQLQRRFFIAPKAIADIRMQRVKATYPYDRYLRLDKVAAVLSEFEGNFCLSVTGSASAPEISEPTTRE